MTRIRITGFENIEPRLRLKLASSIKKSGFDKILKTEYIDHVQDKGFSQPLAPATVKNRQRLELFNNTDPKYSPAKPSLTFTGELWRKVSSNFLPSRLAVVLIASNARHKPYENARTASGALGAALEKRNKGGNIKQLQFKQLQKNRKEASPRISQIFEWQGDRYDYFEPFRDGVFLESITVKLKESILKFFRN